MEKDNTNKIVEQFAIQGTVDSIKPLGAGLINDTYKITTKEHTRPDYVLQHINNIVFPDINMLMNNIIAVTKHIRKKLEEENAYDIDRKCLTFIPLKQDSNKYYYKDEHDKYWRIMIFIPDAISTTEVTPESSYNVGVAFGNFQALLADIPVELGETIKDFHNMEFRLQQLNEAVKNDVKGRVKDVQTYLNDINKYKDEMCIGETLYKEGKLPKRICHCDTKADNILFDKNGKILCVIDLDTVMPNFVYSDIGDFIRFAANTGKEDEPDLNNVGFNFEIFAQFIKGYLESAKCFLTPIEIEYLSYAPMRFAFMIMVRFLCDYINGDTYFKIQYPEHNLIRTRAQHKLFLCLKENEQKMKDYIKSCL